MNPLSAVLHQTVGGFMTCTVTSNGVPIAGVKRDPKGEVIDPQGPEAGELGRVLRGGSFRTPPGDVRSAYRHSYDSEAGERHDNQGFRPVLDFA